MTYKLFIDDERYPPNSWCDSEVVIARSSTEAIETIKAKGMPSFISFDHDLGGDDTAVEVVKWIEDECVDNNLRFSEDFWFYVHSQNPIGARNIGHRMANLVEYFGDCNG